MNDQDYVDLIRLIQRECADLIAATRDMREAQEHYWAVRIRHLELLEPVLAKMLDAERRVDAALIAMQSARHQAVNPERDDAGES